MLCIIILMYNQIYLSYVKKTNICPFANISHTSLLKFQWLMNRFSNPWIKILKTFCNQFELFSDERISDLISFRKLFSSVLCFI